MIDDEEKLLQAVALRNANSIFLARQRAEQELIRVKEALEAKTEALAEARQAAQAANEAKNRFVNMLSHELRTPLGAIGGYAALLEEGIHGALSAGQRDYVAGIRHNQGHLLRLVNELLDLAKIEAGQFNMNVTAVPVRTVLESVHTMIEPQVRTSQLRFDVQVEDPTLSVRGDRARVEQIVLNLLSNAVKFTPPGGSVCIATAPAADKVHLRVQDTGVGIAAGQLEAVFQPFVQIEASQPRGSRGTGLGLAISRELARAMHGDLTVESERGKGSTFTLSLPRAEVGAV